ncbi:hypothetical protein Tco_0545631 [Tanacetum coccineum]
MRDASGMIGRTEARAPSFPPRPSLCVGDIKRIGAFGGTGELYLLLDRCVGQRDCGTCCPPFLLCFENRVNREWAEGKEGGSSAKPPPIRGQVALPHKHPTFFLLFLGVASINAPPKSPTHIPKALLKFKRKPPFIA